MKTTSIMMLALLIMAGALLLSGCDTAKGGPVAANLDWTWTAPGDDGNVGTASQYSMRYAATADSLATAWNSCSQLPNLPTPSVAGTPEAYATTLTFETGVTYYFAIKAADEVPNWGSLSNIVTVHIPDGISPNGVTDLDVTVTVQ